MWKVIVLTRQVWVQVQTDDISPPTDTLHPARFMYCLFVKDIY